MKCPKCNIPIGTDPGQKFCGNCKTNIAWKAGKPGKPGKNITTAVFGVIFLIVMGVLFYSCLVS